MKPPTLQTIVARAHSRGRSTVTVSVATLQRLLEAEQALDQLAQQTGITETDPRLLRWT